MTRAVSRLPLLERLDKSATWVMVTAFTGYGSYGQQSFLFQVTRERPTCGSCAPTVVGE
jgi:hypothetical protein